nr:MAG TPA: Transcription initiation factor IIE, alpha FINGER, Transcription [Caudoviricetes sp.]
MAVKALEKQRQKKIETWNGQALCPCCKKLFGEMKTIRNLTTWEMPYCKFCGQALDWSDEQ